MDIYASLYLPVLFMDRNTFSKSWKVFCWNVCGINSDKKWVSIRDKITESNCDIVCLQETKKENFDLQFIKNFCPSQFDSFEYLPSVGASKALSLSENPISLMAIWYLEMISVSPWNSPLSMMIQSGC